MSSVSTTVNHGVATITLHRAEHANVFDLDLASGLQSAVERVAADGDVRALLLVGDGAIFCGGGDLTAMAAADDKGGFLAELAGRVHEAVLMLAEIELPVVMGVQGAAAGAGLALTLFGDVVVAGRSTKFLTAYGSVGLTPDCGMSWNLPRVVGLRRAAELLITGRRLDAPTALDWGLVSEVVDDDAIRTRADEIAHNLASDEALSTALGAARRLLRISYTSTLAQHLDTEAQTIAEIGATSGAADHINAFLARTAG